MSKPKEFKLTAGGIATKAEREQQIAARPAPRAELHLTPPGWDTAQVQRHLFQEAEGRIKYLDQRLKTARESIEKGHSHALLRGRAKQDFDRGR